jgi:tetratricopeptide (TPR) repeat protein
LDRGDNHAALGVDVDSPAELARALRQLRRRHARQHGDTELTYRELAARSGYAHGVIGDYFTGQILPPTDRLDVLAVLLGATGEEQKALATARDRIEERRRPPPSPGRQVNGAAAATRTLPRDIASFTGREAELRQLESTAFPDGVVGIHVIGGMAGIGKTAFAVHAAHRLAPRFPDGQIFLALHGHTPGQRPVEPTDALASLLLTAGVSASRIPPGLEPRMGMWRDYLTGKRLLLVLDDAAGHEQLRPLLPGTAGSLVLATSRRHLTALEDARAVSLSTLAPDEAAELLIRLAARPGLSPGDPAVGHITRLCGYLPLAVGILARQLHHHPVWTAAGLAADLAASRDQRLELMHAENVSVAAAFDLSYQDLGPDQQRLFRCLSLHPGTDIDVYAAAALDGTVLSTVRRNLAALYDQHLLTEPAHGRYRFHDLIREHARTLSAMDPPAERDAATDRILDYYLHTACAASRHVARRQPDIIVKPPAARPDLPDREAAVAWLDAERLNLHAAADQAVAGGRPGPAIAISGVMHGYLCSHGHWDQALALHRTALDAARQAGDRSAEPRALTGLGIVQRLIGDTSAAFASFTCALDLCRDLGDRPGEAAALNELGVTQHVAGDPAAVASLSQALEVFHDLGDQSGEAAALNDLALAQLETGDFPAAAAGLARALKLHRSLGDRLWEASALDNIGVVKCLTGDYPAALASHTRALDLFRELGGGIGHANARHNIGVVECLTGDYPSAAASHAQALLLYRDLGNRSGEAKVLNSMGEVELASATSAKAAAHHEQALAIAVAIVSPMEEARAQEGIGRCHLHDGRPAEGARRLLQALAIYQRIGSPRARRVATALQDHGLWPDDAA